MATRVAAWVLALFAAGYLWLLLFMFGRIGKEQLWPLLFIIPALAAFGAAWRIRPILAEGPRLSDLVLIIPLGFAAWFFAALCYGEVERLLREGNTVKQDEALLVVLTFIPAVLSAWVAAAIFWVTIRRAR